MGNVGLMTLAILAAASGQSDCTSGTGVSPVSSGPRETLNMPYMPGTGQTAPPRSVQFGSHVSVQVNVDAAGNNTLGDAANEPSIAVDPTNPDRMAIGWRQFDSVESDFRQAGYGYSTDGGRHWTFPGVLEVGAFRSDPVLDASAEGIFYFDSLDVDTFNCDVFRSLDGGRTWPIKVRAFGGDKPWMAIDKSNAFTHGNVYCMWTGGMTESTDGGNTWEYPGYSPFRWGTISILRNGDQCIGAVAGAYPQTVSFEKRSLTSPVYSEVPLGEAPGLSGPPNPDGLLGQVWVGCDNSFSSHADSVYILSTVGPSGFSDPNHTDVRFSRSSDGGLTWMNSVQINSDPSTIGVFHWFGTMSVAPNGRIDVIWNDTRHSPDNYYISELYYCASYDGGVTWTPNEQLSPAWDSSVGWPQQGKIGDYYHMISDNVGANLAYAATFNGEQDVWFLRIGDYLCQGLVAEQPTSPSVCAGSSVSLQTSATPRGGTITYQWRKDGANLFDTGNILGTQSPTLVFLHAQVSDTGYYECLLRLEGCGAEMTNTAKFTVYPTGSADGNVDGQVNGNDIAAFVSALVDHGPVSARLCAYDLTGDGIVNEADLAPFVSRLLQGL